MNSTLIFIDNYNCNLYINILDNNDKNKEKEVFDVTSLDGHKVCTDYDLVNEANYINLSMDDNNGAENAPDAQLDGQWSDTPRLHRHQGSIPCWGAPSALFNLNKQEAKYE